MRTSFNMLSTNHFLKKWRWSKKQKTRNVNKWLKSDKTEQEKNIIEKVRTGDRKEYLNN